MKIQAPKNLHSERAVLCCALYTHELYSAAADVLQPGHFYDGRHVVIWEAMLALSAQGASPDTSLVISQLEQSGNLDRAGGGDYVLGLTDSVPTASALEYHAAKVRGEAARRALQAAALEVVELTTKPAADVAAVLDQAEMLIGKACAQRLNAAEPTRIGDAAESAYREIIQQAEDKRPAGHATGLIKLDEYLGGMVPGELVILAGRPGMGKSALAGRIAHGVATLSKAPVYCASIEMSKLLWARRMLSAEARVNSKRMREAKLTREEMSALGSAVTRLDQLPIYIHDTRDLELTVLDVRHVARRLKAKHGDLALVVVDYLQLMKPAGDADSREQEIAAISRGLKKLTTELEIPVLALAQLGRGVDQRADKRPMLSDLRESGAIEQDADTVLFIYRDEEYHQDSKEAGIAEVIIGKQRSGPTGTVRLAFSGEHTTFNNLEEHRSADNGYDWRRAYDR